MGSIHSIGFTKKSIFSNTLSRIREMFPDSVTVKTPTGIMVKHPGGILVPADMAAKAKNNMRIADMRNSAMMNQNYNFKNKTAGLDKSIRITHGPTPDTSNYSKLNKSAHQ